MLLIKVIYQTETSLRPVHRLLKKGGAQDIHTYVLDSISDNYPTEGIITHDGGENKDMSVKC